MLPKFSQTSRYIFSILAVTYGSVYADVGLRLDRMFGPLSEHFSIDVSSSIARGFLLFPSRDIKPQHFQISIDSSRVQYRRMIAGFPDGLTIDLSLDQYLKLEFEKQAIGAWVKEQRRIQRKR